MSFLDNILNGGYARGLKTLAGFIDGAASPAPTVGQVLTAVDAEHMEWADPGGAGVVYGNTAGTATEGNDTRLGKLILTGGALISALAAPVPTAGQVLTALTGGTMRFSTPTTRSGMPMIDPPATPDAWNIEFDAGTSADLATLGFEIRLNASPFTLLTRAGDVDFWGDPTLAGISTTQYRSTVLGGRLYLQFKSTVTITRAMTGDGIYSVRGGPASLFGSAQQPNSGGADQFLALVTDRVAAPFALGVSSGKAAQIGYITNGTKLWLRGDNLVSGGQDLQTAGDMSVGTTFVDYQNDTWSIRLSNSGLRAQTFAAAAHLGRVGIHAGPYVPSAPFVTWGMYLQPASTTLVGDQLHCNWYDFDYFRKYPVNTWCGLT